MTRTLFDPTCLACTVVRNKKLTEDWQDDLIHDLFVSGVHVEVLLTRVAGLMTSLQNAEDRLNKIRSAV